MYSVGYFMNKSNTCNSEQFIPVEICSFEKAEEYRKASGKENNPVFVIEKLN